MFRVVFLLLAVTAGLCKAVQFERVPLPDGRIVGGSDTTIYEFPHQVSMRYYGNHRCGGSIYSQNIIISAAHCVQNVNVAAMKIVAGATLISDPHYELPVKRIITHPKYRTLNNDYDVAILILGGLFRYNSAIQPIALATERPTEGTFVTVTGWGTLEEGGKVSNTLQKVDVNYVSNADCKKAYTSLFITSRMLCAGVVGGGKDACQGDSGGPLIVNNKLLGIVSWGTGCARENYPGVYASVPDLHDWIVEVADSNTISFA